MLLTRLEITDFLSIKGTLPIDLDKKTTIMLGSNDHGKSNVLRAIQHLNDGDHISEDEANWDATEEDNWDPKSAPGLSFTFSLTAAERREWKGVVEELVKAAAERLLASETAKTEGQDGGASDPVPLATPAPTPTPALPAAPATATKIAVAPAKSGKAALVPAEEEGALAELPESALDPAATTLTLTRSGVGGGLQFSGVLMDNLPDGIQQFFEEKKPRVELFEALSGSLQDSATAETIVTPDYEFLQGVFLLCRHRSDAQLSSFHTERPNDPRAGHGFEATGCEPKAAVGTRDGLALSVAP
jgi:hypothetical protein